MAGQIGLERTPEEYIEAMVGVFREVHRVLRDDGVMFLNMGDSYNAYNGNRGASQSLSANVEDALPKLSGGHGLSSGEPTYELRPDLTTEERAYVLSELSKHFG